MSVRRSKMHVLSDILRVIRNTSGMAKPTHIMYKANLSHKLLKSHLSFLIENGFIERKNVGNNAYYSITPKGMKFIDEFKKIEKFSMAFGLPL